MAESARNPDTLQREIERTRHELARTVDTIADRVSPKNVAKRGMDQVKENAASARKRLPGGGSGDFHAELASRDAEESSTSTLARGGVARSSLPAGMVVVVGVGLLVVVVVTWRRKRQ